MSLSRRNFMLKAGLASAGVFVLSKNLSANSIISEDSATEFINVEKQRIVAPSGKFSQAPLPYGFDALEPIIDAKTMEIHYTKHHAGYVKKLNAAVEDKADFPDDLIQVFKKIKKYDDTIRNNAGGHWNHEFFWASMHPSKMETMPSGELMTKINAKYGSFDAFKKQFADEAAKRFGSGWAWLCVDKKGELCVCSTPNQDNPYMVKNCGIPLLGLDVWEHAYYLKYQNKRTDYISGFFQIINWGIVETRLMQATADKK